MATKAYRQAIEPWLEEINTGHEQKQYTRALILSLCGDDQAVPLLLGLLEAQEAETQYKAALLLLRYHGDERAIEIMIDMLHHGDTNSRIVAARTLDKFDAPEVTAAFADALRDPESYVRLAAIRYLAKKGDESVIDPLVLALDDEDSWNRRQVIEVLGELGGRRTAEALSDVVSYHEDEHTRCLALEALATIGDPAGLDAFRRALKDGNPSVESAAKWGLDSWSREEQNVEHLRQLYAVMKEDETTHSELGRLGLVIKLSDMGTPGAIRAIEDFLQDPHEMVRFIAIMQLRLYGTVDAVPVLKSVIETDTGVYQEMPVADAGRLAIEEIQKREHMREE